MDAEDLAIWKAAELRARGEPTRFIRERFPNGTITVALKGDDAMEHRFLINLSTKRDGQPAMLILPGAQAYVSGHVQLPVKLEGLIVDSKIAERFALYDLRVGSNSRFASADEPIAMTPWAVRHELLERMLTITEYAARSGDVGCDPAAAELLGQLSLLDLGLALPGQDITAIVTNTSREPAVFEGALVVVPTSVAQREEDLPVRVRAACEYILDNGEPADLRRCLNAMSTHVVELATREIKR